MKTLVRLFATAMVFLFLADTSFSQINFQAYYGGTANDFSYHSQQTSDGGYILMGYTYSFGGINTKAYVVKINSTGDTLWTKTYGSTGYDYFYGGQQTSDGGYIFSGYTTGPTFGSADVYLVKTDSVGNEQWSRVYGGASTDQGTSVIETSDGGYAVTGFTGSIGGGASDVFIVKTNNAGNPDWMFAYGGTANEYGNSILQTADGGFLVAGHIYDPSASNTDMLIMRVNANGGMGWAAAIGGPLPDTKTEVARKAIITSDGGYLIAGYTVGYTASEEGFLVKLDTSGIAQWAKYYGGATYNDEFFDVIEKPSGGYVVLGSTRNFGIAPGDENMYLLSLDSNGDTLWTRSYGYTGQDVGNCITLDTDGGYVLSGFSTSFFNNNPMMFIVKVDSMGNGCQSLPTATVYAGVTPQGGGSATGTASGALSQAITSNLSYGTIKGFVCGNVGIEEATFSSGNMQVFPNPTVSGATLNFGKAASRYLQLRNMIGKILFETTTSAVQLNIDMSDFPAGIYFVTSFDEKNNLVVRKIVKM